MHNYEIGDHLSVRRNVYTHHGLYLGDDEVMHYAGDLNDPKAKLTIKRISLEDFAGGNIIRSPINIMDPQFPQQEIVQRALKREGEVSYNIITNNCEHFVSTCRYGLKVSKQVLFPIILFDAVGDGASFIGAKALGAITDRSPQEVIDDYDSLCRDVSKGWKDCTEVLKDCTEDLKETLKDGFK